MRIFLEKEKVIKDPLLGLRQFLIIESPLKMMRNVFKTSFRS